MSRHLINALLFIAAYAMNTGASAQTVYKCGNTYRQEPCPGGVPVQASDSRTPQDKAQADAATVKTEKLANQMEKTRVAQEKKDLATNTATALPTSPAQPMVVNPADNNVTPPLVVAKKPKLIKPRKAEGFVAQVPGKSKLKKTKVTKAKAKADAAAN